MNARSSQNRQLGLFLAVAVALHAALLVIPVSRQLAEPADGKPLSVRLQHTVTEILPVPARSKPPPELLPLPRQPVLLAPLPEPPAEIASEEPAEPVSSPSTARILSRQFDYSTPKPLFGKSQPAQENRPDFYVRQRPVLNDVLNTPSLQMPFADERVYLIKPYSSVDRFFDRVAIPFSWVTDNGTRFECAWVLIIGGCGWGPNSLFNRPPRKRKPENS